MAPYYYNTMYNDVVRKRERGRGRGKKGEGGRKGEGWGEEGGKGGITIYWRLYLVIIEMRDGRASGAVLLINQ